MRNRSKSSSLVSGRLRAKYAPYTQEQVDKIFFAAALAANKMRLPLAKMAVEETGMGRCRGQGRSRTTTRPSTSTTSIRTSRPAASWNATRASAIPRSQSPSASSLRSSPRPTPRPPRSSSASSAEDENALIISPHPRAKQCTIEAAKIVLEAAVKAGAPEDIIGWIDQPTVPLSGMIMREADLILATGGPGMVKAAYSSGKPAVGVGAGNTPAVIDSSADIKLAASSILHSKTFDNGMICASEQSVIVLKDVYDEFKKEMALRGAYFLTPRRDGQGEKDHHHQRRAQREDRRPERLQDRRTFGLHGARGQQSARR